MGRTEADMNSTFFSVAFEQAMSDMPREFSSAWLRAAMRFREISEHELAAMIGRSRQTIWRMLTDVVKIDRPCAIAIICALQLSPDWHGGKQPRGIVLRDKKKRGDDAPLDAADASPVVAPDDSAIPVDESAEVLPSA